MRAAIIWRLAAGCLLLSVLVIACKAQPTVGDDVRLHQDGLAEIIVAVDGTAYDDLGDAVIAKDKVGYQDVVLSGRAFLVSDNTSALVIDIAFGKTKVRIMDGEHQGLSGWVPDEWIEKD